MTAAAEVRAVEAELRSVARAARDANGHFPAMYAGVTGRVADRIDASGFEDERRMQVFTRAFAERYLAPRRGIGPAPSCWHAAFEAGRDSRLLIVQHLLLGINAHVNFDLPQVVVAVADREGSLQAVRADFDTINDVLSEQRRTVLRNLGRVSRWVNVAAGAGGGRLFEFSLERARDQAWGAAERLWPLDPAGRAGYLEQLDRLVAVLAYLITKPGMPAAPVVPLLRRLEHSDPVRVTAALLGS